MEELELALYVMILSLLEDKMLVLSFGNCNNDDDDDA